MRNALHPAAILALCAGVLASSGCAGTSASAPDGGAAAPGAERFGVEPLGIRVSAAGHLLDFRMRVLEPGKAAPLLARRSDCHLVAEKTGQVLKVARSPKIGPLRATVRTPDMVKRGRIYGALFANPGRLVRPGDTVTVVIGDFRTEHVVVQ
jgi:hypothetical protein